MLIFIVIIVLILYLLYQLNYEEKHEHFRTTQPETVKTIYKMFHVLDEIFDKKKIVYWIEGGTMLGAMRHKGLIPWDDDGDIQVLDKYFNDIKSCEKDFAQNDLVLLETWFGFKIFPKNGKEIKGFPWKYPAIDIFIVIEKDGKIIYKSERARELWGYCVLTSNDIKNLEKYDFGNEKLNGISKESSKKYLDSCYGNDWSDYAYEQYDHENETSIKRVKVKLTAEEKLPGKPFF